MQDAPRGSVHAGVTSGELRVVAQLDPEPAFFLEDWSEDDDGVSVERTRRGIGLTELGDVARALASGERVVRQVPAYGRVYCLAYDERDPRDGALAPLPGERSLWFHPMNEARMIFRMRVRDAVAALLPSVRWALAHLPHEGEPASAWRTSLEQAERDLAEAARRCGVTTGGHVGA